MKNQQGTVFLSTMICVFVMTMVGGYTYQASSQNIAYMNRLQKSTQAQHLAEAGLVRALSSIRTSWSNVSNAGAFPLTSLGVGTYDASVSVVSGRYLITSVGTVDNVTRTVTAEVSAPAGSALNYMFASGGNLVIDPGTGQASGTITGNLYAGGNATLSGPSGGTQLAITGGVDALGNVTTGSAVTVSGSQNSNYAYSQSFPTIDYSYYQTIAQANGTYVNGNVTYNSGNIPASPSGGVIYVNGNVTIRGTQSTTACIIATGNIQIEKSGSTYPRVTVNQYSNFPAMMAQGNISFSSNGNGGAYLTTTGLVHAAGNIQVSSGNHDSITMTGSVVAQGNIDTSGMTAWNTLTATYSSQSPPGVSGLGSASSTIRSYNR